MLKITTKKIKICSRTVLEHFLPKADVHELIRKRKKGQERLRNTTAGID